MSDQYFLISSVYDDFKDPKLLFELEQRGSKENLEDRSLTFVNGLDYVNLNYIHLVAQDVQTATVIITHIINVYRPLVIVIRNTV